MNESSQAITVGRYLLHRQIARGGMATIHIARLLGDVGFSRIVAAKRMRPELAEDHEFVAMFLDEARIASKIHHRNVVPVLDVVTMRDEVVLVQEYVHGAPLSVLLRASHEAKAHVPVPVAAAIACQVLAGLHAAHETDDEMGTPLHIVHRDVSPQNIIIATDGSARLLDFGVAKASVAAHVTRKGTFKGKLGYSSPEQIRGQANRQSDIYALGVVLWELLVGRRLHSSTQREAELITEIMAGKSPPITEALAGERAWVGNYRWKQLEALDPIIRKALDVNFRRRWPTAADMEEAIAAAVPLASATDIATWLRAVAGDFVEERAHMIAEEEASWRRTLAAPAAAEPAPPRPSSGSLAEHMFATSRPSSGSHADPEPAPPSPASSGAVQAESLQPKATSLLVRYGPAALIAGLVLLALIVAVRFHALDRAQPKDPPPAPRATEPATPAVEQEATPRVRPERSAPSRSRR